jgi:3,4-dihydroxy-2-butanone 4-phosphate synthase
MPSAATHLSSAVAPRETRLHHAVSDMRLGRPVILVDDFGRENEADLIAAAEMTPAAVLCEITNPDGSMRRESMSTDLRGDTVWWF